MSDFSSSGTAVVLWVVEIYGVGNAVTDKDLMLIRFDYEEDRDDIDIASGVAEGAVETSVMSKENSKKAE
ncbi:hypothetical protein DASC09_013460 [Saccharomycopsis crataegensis]|uniref:Uncharacterized protein n=1 Tax=Saccharomycopsis crataegensis TaxID=43959 RepID=A0AAV5QHC8_9ASCO|nr:hypothetical protein DASC09_013460 [Saccharomycopsis crataegensis]